MKKKNIITNKERLMMKIMSCIEKEVVNQVKRKEKKIKNRILMNKINKETWNRDMNNNNNNNREILTNQKNK
jgi:hypothetical protein